MNFKEGDKIRLSDNPKNRYRDKQRAAAYNLSLNYDYGILIEIKENGHASVDWYLNNKVIGSRWSVILLPDDRDEVCEAIHLYDYNIENIIENLRRLEDKYE